MPVVHRPRRAALLPVAVLAAVASLASGCTTDGPTPAPIPSSSVALSGPPADLARYYDQSLTWKGCGGEFECAQVTVPRDWSALGG